MTTYKTGNPIGSTAVKDLYDNAENFDRAVNAESPNWVDRLGKTRTSWSLIEQSIDAVKANADVQIKNTTNNANALIASLGYQVPVPYIAGLEMATPNQTVSYEGAVYAPIPEELPFTTSGTFEIDKFRLIQGVSGADLSSSYGSSMVGHGDKSVAEALDERVLYAYDLAGLQSLSTDRLTDGQRGAISNGLEYRWSASKQQWLNIGKQKLLNEGSTDTDSLVDWANFPDAPRRSFVIHHYNDREMCVLDNVGEDNNILLLRNARNPNRRHDKPENFVGNGSFVRCTNVYPYMGSYSGFNVFEVLYQGDLKWGNQGYEKTGVNFINSQLIKNYNYAFTFDIQTPDQTRLVDIKTNNKSVFQFRQYSETLARLDAGEEMTSGLYIGAPAGAVEINAGAGNYQMLLTASDYVMHTGTGWGFVGTFVDAGSAPTSSTSPGERGDFYVKPDGSYAYFCYKPNKWCRVAADTNW